MESFDQKIGLVLPGGGARGAYQVGVLKAISDIQGRSEKSPFDVISGTSAGAINASMITSEINNFHQSIIKLENVWGGFRKVIHVETKSSLAINFDQWRLPYQESQISS